MSVHQEHGHPVDLFDDGPPPLETYPPDGGYDPFGDIPPESFEQAFNDAVLPEGDPFGGAFDESQFTAPAAGTGPRQFTEPAYRPPYDGKKRRGPAPDPEMVEVVEDTLLTCLATTHGRTGSEVVDLLNNMFGSKNVLEYLDESRLRTLKRMREVLASSAADSMDGEFDLFDLPDLDASSQAVIKEVRKVRDRHNDGDLPKNPTAVWRSLCDRVQRHLTRSSAANLAAAIDADAPVDELMKIFTSLEPPTTQKTIVNESFSKSAADWMRDAEAAAAERPPIRYSSGYRTMDYASTAKRNDGTFAEPIGTFGPGELHIYAAPSGNGKSSAVRRLITAVTEDGVVGWRREHFRTLLAFTEESAPVIAEAAGLLPGQPFHHLERNIILADVGASRKRFIHAVWDLVIEAYHRSRDTGLPIVDAGLPEFVALDYITAIQEQGESETLASEVTMDLLLRGIAGWRLQEMEQFSGENFAAYAGMSWPSGMEHFQPAVIAFAQFRKIDGAMYYDPETCNEDDFVIENSNGQPGWRVEPTDFRIPKIGEIRGSGKIVQHATTVVLLHRSRPQAAKYKDPATGKYRLSDDRARWVFMKTRNSSDLPFIPMRFDSNASGNRGQFYDLLAEKAIDLGKLKPEPSYVQPGDPIVPPRPVRSPFAGIAY